MLVLKFVWHTQIAQIRVSLTVLLRFLSKLKALIFSKSILLSSLETLSQVGVSSFVLSLETLTDCSSGLILYSNAAILSLCLAIEEDCGRSGFAYKIPL